MNGPSAAGRGRLEDCERSIGSEPASVRFARNQMFVAQSGEEAPHQRQSSDHGRDQRDCEQTDIAPCSKRCDMSNTRQASPIRDLLCLPFFPSRSSVFGKAQHYSLLAGRSRTRIFLPDLASNGPCAAI